MIKLERCKKADIYDNKEQLLCEAQVNVTYLGEIFLYTPRSFDHHQQEDYPIVFFDPVMGLSTCRCRLTAPVHQSQQTVFRCAILKEIAQVQRRNDIKVPLSIPVTITVTYMPDPTIARPEGSYPATVGNISAGGVYLRSELEVEPGVHLDFEFDETGEPIFLTAEVLRAEEIPRRRPKEKISFGYGCRFVDLSACFENRLRSYVFQEERRLYMKKSPMDDYLL